MNSFALRQADPADLASGFPLHPGIGGEARVDAAFEKGSSHSPNRPFTKPPLDFAERRSRPGVPKNPGRSPETAARRAAPQP